MSSSLRFALEGLASALKEGLRQELLLSPKPGLVDRYDSGSHPDLSFSLMSRSVDLVGRYYEQTARALVAGADQKQLVALGRATEDRMYAELGTNTHKGAIFIGGLLLSARARIDSDLPRLLQASVGQLARTLFNSRDLEPTHGGRARRAHGVSGIIGEARCGLPSLFTLALPGYRQGLKVFGEQRPALFLVMARLMQTLEDTTALHRCGPPGLARLRSDGRKIETCLMRGEDPLPLLKSLNSSYRRLNLTMGGVADMLGMTLGYESYLRLAHSPELHPPPPHLPGPIPAPL